MTVVHDDNGNPINNLNPLPTRASYDNSDSFSTGITTPSATGGVVVQAATSGKSIYVTDLIISPSAAMNITVEDGAGTDLIPPIHIAANSPFEHTFATPLKVTVSQSLNIASSAVGQISVFASGYVA